MRTLGIRSVIAGLVSVVVALACNDAAPDVPSNAEGFASPSGSSQTPPSSTEATALGGASGAPDPGTTFPASTTEVESAPGSDGSTAPQQQTPGMSDVSPNTDSTDTDATNTDATNTDDSTTASDATSTDMETSANEPTSPATPSLIGDVEFSVPSQSFRGTLTVELSSSVAGEIRYTTDGSLPIESSPLYEEPLVLEQTTELRARAFTNSAAPVSPSTALYVARDFDTTSNIPLLIIDGYTGGKPTDKETYLRAAFMLFEPGDDGLASFENLPTVATRSGHRLRGQSSQSHPKTPYRVELWDNWGEDADYPLFGMPAEADWALISLYVDRSLIRNALIYELGPDIGLAAPRQAFAEVYVNHDSPVLSQSHYEGVYNVTETIKNQKGRLNLKQLRPDDTAPEDLSGGYIMSFEYMAVEGPRIECAGDDVFSRSAPGSFTPIPVTEGFCWDDLELRDPKNPNSEQTAWITQYIQEFHDALHSDPIGPYGDWIDIESFVDFFLLTELTRDMDAYIRSAYFHKDREGKLIAGPLWDFDLSMGAGGYFDNTSIEGWQVANRLVVHDWFVVLTQDPAFLDRVRTRWAELRQGPLSDAALTQRIEALTAPLAEAAERDHAKWSVSSVREEYFIVQFPEGDTWQGQVNALRDWLLQRAAWMDGEAGNPFAVNDYPYVP